MNGNDSPHCLDLSRSAMYTTARMSDDEHDDEAFGTPNASYVCKVDENGTKPRMSMYSMKLFDPLLASPAVVQHGNHGSAPNLEQGNGLLFTPTNGNGSQMKSPGSSPMKSNDTVHSSRLSETIVESLKNQELSFHEQLREKDEEIESLKSQLTSAYQVISLLKVAHEELMDAATRAIETEKEEKEKLRNKIKSMFNEI